MRILKAGGDKKMWQPEVAILLDLKKKLTAAQETSKSPSATSGGQAKNGPTNSIDVKTLEAKIGAQVLT